MQEFHLETGGQRAAEHRCRLYLAQSIRAAAAAVGARG
jgi:hypothetical protein